MLYPPIDVRVLRPFVLLGGLVAPLGLAIVASVACYDVDALRGGERPGVGPAETGPTVGGEEAGAPGFCAQAGDAAIFCDDFDEPLDVPLEARWKGLPPSIPPVLYLGDASIARGVTDIAPTSKPYGLVVALERLGTTRTSAVLNHAPGRSGGARAVEVSVALHASELTLLPAPDAGVTDAGAGDAGIKDASVGEPARGPQVVVLSLGTVAGDFNGASLYLRPGSLELRSGTQGGATVETDVSQVAAFDYQAVLKVGWVTLRIAIGDRDAVIRRATEGAGVAPSCPAAKAVAVAWGSLPLGKSGCVAVSEAMLPLEDRELTVVVGGTTDDRSRVRLNYDDLLLRGIP